MVRRFYGRVGLAVVLLVGVTSLFFLYSWPIEIDPTSQEFLEDQRCPACYGQDLCHEVYAGRLTLKRWTRFSASRLLNARNVYYGALKGKGDVVAKKLGHDNELDRSLEKAVCHLAGKPPYYCNSAHYIKLLTKQIYSRPLESGSATDHSPSLKLEFGRDAALYVNSGNDYLGCTDTQEMMDYLVRKPQQRGKTSLENVLSLLLINPEPLVLATFTASEGWPFPNYYGSCGRVAFVEDSGNPLTHFYDRPFVVRAKLAIQILEIATALSDKHNHLSLYLTDWSESNFAVDNEGTVKLIDLENLVVVNKTRVRAVGAPGANVVHTSAPEDGYSLVDLCSHAQSDHNLYGACQWILYPHSEIKSKGTGGGRGLLYDIPQSVRSKHVLLEKLLRECSRPSHPVPGARFEAAHQLKDILRLIISEA